MYVFQDVPGKGNGFVALQRISKGTRIFSEEPIITLPSRAPLNEQLRTSICSQVDVLSTDQRRDFLSMPNIHEYKARAEQYIGIFRSNALPAELEGRSSSKHAVSTTHAITIHKRAGTRTSSDTQSMR